MALLDECMAHNRVQAVTLVCVLALRHIAIVAKGSQGCQSGRTDQGDQDQGDQDQGKDAGSDLRGGAFPMISGLLLMPD